MFKKLLKILLGLVGVVVLLVGALVLTLFLTLRANPPESFYEFAGSPPAADAAPVMIVGATRGSGLEAARRLHERGETIVALVRPSSDRTALEELDAVFVVGDAMNPEQLAAAFSAQPLRAVVSTIGCLSCEPPPDFIGNRNIADAAKAAGVERMILISSIGVGDSADAAPFMSRLFLSKILPLKDQAEEYLRNSGLDYTIIRPGGLPNNAPLTGNGAMSEDRTTFGFISRPDLGALIVSTLDDPATIGKTYAAMDPGVESPF
jgi:nucleoside-diphosphate-sugar epimerase